MVRSANLTDAEVTEDQVLQAKSHGATMPNGQKYEEWIKSSRQGGNNSGPS